MEGRGVALLLLALALVALICTTEAKPTTKSYAEWQRSPSFRLSVLLRRGGTPGAVDSGSSAHETCVVLAADYGQPHRGLTDAHHVLLFTRPEAYSHDVEQVGEDEASRGEVLDFYGHTEAAVMAFARERLPCLAHADFTAVAPPPAAADSDPANKDEILELVKSGPPGNRIDLVFMGDGYTESERERFVGDMKRLVQDMFASTTFASHLPLFNIWAVFRPSVDSGIGSGGKPKNTAFGLYRDGTELRGIYTSKPQAARDACREVGPDACDFPTLIGNDDYYGGLGGEFTISTRSLTSGTIVLRHELGHNLIYVGEEYDGGTAYFGVNHARSLGTVGWTHWLTNTSKPLVAQQSKLLLQQHAWYNLSRAPFEIKFDSAGNYKRWLLTYSISGAPTADSVRITLDGKELPFNSAGTLDRTFTSIFSDEGFTRGPHVLKFAEGKKPAAGGSGGRARDGIMLQLCNYVLTELMDEDHYHTEFAFPVNVSPLYIGAYNTYKLGGSLVGYRPDHERCLMRNMSSPHFCVEGMWLNLLSRISLIDSVNVTTDAKVASAVLHALPLGQKRQPAATTTDDAPTTGERYVLTWLHNGQEQPELQDRFEWTLPLEAARGRWVAKLHFLTPEVRYDPRGYTTSTQAFSI
ncbi:IgA Peptidase M64 protein [Acanthamoeba castellanii str. Neff]|uniref:IgA Peptidase M64 protein n=1 Tax=Acanthamoeba castellanii (strain ATCC 30010 / Neff) TaxID=1257118 RepID=L8GFD4_ACACF|nr:IgA Peptidase M64 protein [Acanthamoeba castellanii str. Neff]ELR10891.1 IgA Peptidase M64 protein [Acanthamoeba castellanii str. Neff]